MTATACSRAWATCWSIRISGCCSSPWTDKPKRLRVNGSARVSDRDPLLGETVGAQLIVRVEARAIFPNCPRYIPAMQMVSPSIYTPQPKCEAPEPAWKSFDSFKDAVHPRQPTWKG